MADNKDEGENSGDEDDDIKCPHCQSNLEFGHAKSTTKEGTIYWNCQPCDKWFSTTMIFPAILDSSSELVELPGLPPEPDNDD